MAVLVISSACDDCLLLSTEQGEYQQQWTGTA